MVRLRNGGVLDTAFPPAERTGPPGGRYSNELFTNGTGKSLNFNQYGSTPSGGIEVDRVLRSNSRCHNEQPGAAR